MNEKSPNLRSRLTWMHPKSRSIGMRVKRIIFTSVLIFSLILLIVVSLIISRQELDRHEARLIRSIESQAHMIELEISQYLRRGVSLTSNASLMRLLRNAHDDTTAVIQMRQLMSTLINDLFIANPRRQIFVFYVEDIFVYESEYVMPMSSFPFPGLQENILAGPFNTLLNETAISTDNDEHRFAYFFRNISYREGYECILAIRVSYESLAEHLYFDNDDVVTGMILTHVQANGEPYSRVHFPPDYNNTDHDTADYTILTSSSIIDGSHLELALPPFYGLSTYMRNLALWILPIPLLILIAVFVSNRTSLVITRSLNTFLASLNSGNYDELKESLENKPLDTEVEIIKSEFLKTLINVDDAHKQLTLAEKHRFRMELNLLHERMNPHMLYNSIAVLCVYAQNRMDDDAMGILLALSNYYRRVLTDDKDIITLDTELSILSHYLEVTNRITTCHYTLNINKDEAMGEMLVLKHMLQPLVENTVKHAYSDRDEGVIHINCRMHGNHMVFEIKDDGDGMDAKTVTDILAQSRTVDIGQDSGLDGNGYGLRNLIRRLDAFCGDDHDLHIESTPGKGTMITIILPAELTLQ